MPTPFELRSVRLLGVLLFVLAAVAAPAAEPDVLAQLRPRHPRLLLTAEHFAVGPAIPATSAENQIKGVTVPTAAGAADGSEVRIAILLTPVGDHWPAVLPSPTLTPLMDWK